ncbi:PREDICTED: uncharacterized protein LOC109185273 [Ipomoea nil]|uniref:uncharacterized protein LOC109185273 n=1 Tax=Ipomoea nil TaxID=35883 RepID=UPI000901B9D0|nr:PREDICTED: uncharacterized protein LOC109185273 [Ipomoea nil]
MSTPYSLPQATCNPPGSQSMAMVACCAICGAAHASQACLLLDPSGQSSLPNMEQVDMIGYSRPQNQGQGYGNYGQQGRNQFGPSWNNQGVQGRNPPPGFQGNQASRGGNQLNQQWRGNQGHGNNQNQQGSSQPSQDVDMKTLMNMMMSQMSQISKLQSQVENLQAQNQGGGTQGSTLASSSSGRLPANTENPRNHVNAITTRSGKSLKDPPFPSNDLTIEEDVEKDEDEERPNEEEIEKNLESENDNEPLIQRNKSKGKEPIQEGNNSSKKNVNKGKQIDDSVIPCNLLPFPQRLWKTKETERENKFKTMLDKLEISMPFVEAITQIPSYKKFLKDILSNKKRLEKSAVVDLSEGALTCAVLQKNLPPKLKDPGSFSIPCIVGGFVVSRALCDLGASVSLMPYSLCKRLNLGEPKPTLP